MHSADLRQSLWARVPQATPVKSAASGTAALGSQPANRSACSDTGRHFPCCKHTSATAQSSRLATTQRPATAEQSPRSWQTRDNKQSARVSTAQ